MYIHKLDVKNDYMYLVIMMLSKKYNSTTTVNIPVSYPVAPWCHSCWGGQQTSHWCSYNEGHHGWPLDTLDLVFATFWVGLKELSKAHLHYQHTETECIHLGRVLVRQAGFRSSIGGATWTCCLDVVQEVGWPIAGYFCSPSIREGAQQHITTADFAVDYRVGLPLVQIA